MITSSATSIRLCTCSRVPRKTNDKRRVIIQDQAAVILAASPASRGWNPCAGKRRTHESLFDEIRVPIGEKTGIGQPPGVDRGIGDGLRLEREVIGVSKVGKTRPRWTEPVNCLDRWLSRFQ